MALSHKIKKYLDSLSDSELFVELARYYGEFVPVWEECSKEEYEKNYGPEDDYSWEKMEKRLSSANTYKKEPHWNNEQPGIIWQIKHCQDKPDFYTYHRLAKQEFTLMLGSDMIDYLYCRKPNWYQK